MPQPLRTLCIALAAMLVADLGFLAVDSLETHLPEPADRQFMLALNSVVAMITVVILGGLLAFSLRLRFTCGILQAFAATNALVLISGSLLIDGMHLFESLRDGMQTTLQWAEAAVSLALVFSLRSANARFWYEKGEP